MNAPLPCSLHCFADVPLLERIAQSFDMYGFEFGALASIFLVSAICGLVGSIVVGNRMAFFSDAMSHCAFAGVSIGIVVAFLTGLSPNSDEIQWVVPLVMVLFGSLVGLGIVYVREKTTLASDTVIGVFFAGSIGIGTMLLTAFKDRKMYDPERFLFGGPGLVKPIDLLNLCIVLTLAIVLLIWRYNGFLLASFNASLARSRGFAVRFDQYAFIVLLALVVNFSICAVGVLLINAMLIVPAATASNLAGNMRQMFRYTVALAIATGMAGLYISNHLRIGNLNQFGPSGTIITLGVILFAISMGLAAFRKRFLNS
jgi:zinc transport system permease protein